MSPALAYRPILVAARSLGAALAIHSWRARFARAQREESGVRAWEAEGGSLANESDSSLPARTGTRLARSAANSDSPD